MIDPAPIRRVLDNFGDVEEIFAQLSIEEWAAAYCRYSARNAASEASLEWDEDPDGWAPELYFASDPAEHWTERDEERRRAFLLGIVEEAPNDDVLGSIGAGPFEDFLCNDESRLAWVEKQAAVSAKFRRALAGVWIDSWASEEVFLRVEAAAGVELSWAEGRGPRPGTRELARPTPEEAAVAWFFPHQTDAIAVGSRIDGDHARVWLLTRYRAMYHVFSESDLPQRFDNVMRTLTSDPVPFAEYEAVCVREGGLWRRIGGQPGFSDQTPEDIRKRAGEMKSGG